MKALAIPITLWGTVLALCAGYARDGDNQLRREVVEGEPIPAEAVVSSMQRYHVPGMSIAVIRRGKIDWAKGYGVLEAGMGHPVDTTTIFQAASISKPVTAAGALRLVDADALALDADVNQALRTWKLPESAFTSNQAVTLRRLLSHSAGVTVHGFPGYAEGAELPTLVQILEGVKPANTEPIRVDTEPGKEFRYSGGGYTVVQQLMLDATNESFPRGMRTLVLQPTGMQNSTYEQPLPREWRSRAAVGHTKRGKPLAGGWHTYPEMGAAALWTTPTDLARFAIEVWRSYHGRSAIVLSQRLTRMMLTREKGDYGLGFALPSAGVFRFQHAGGNAGYRCFLVMSVESGDGVAIMTNAELGEGLIDEVFAAIAAAYGWHA